ncbi:MAG TPA: ATP-binding cassette domain-containing protein [Nodularia sp. (in: cyanobacteria)]|nr:ATP-binding cassette domain-containing protein [Nodularia sp. (in: cyanobacteria)]
MVSTKTKGSELKILGLTKVFGDTTVLKSLNLEVAPGEFIAIVGRSGCGKSTLLRLISGLDKPSDGGILVDGEPLRKLNHFVRVMFQDPRLLPWKRVIENVSLGLKGKNWLEKATRVLAQVGLKDRASDEFINIRETVLEQVMNNEGANARKLLQMSH